MNRLILDITLALAVYYDSRENRIPNLLCGISMAAGLISTIYAQGIKGGMLHLIWGLGLGVCVFPLWCGRILGGGDVKLLLVAGLLLAKDSIPFLMCSGICLGIHGMVLLIRRRNYFERMRVFFQYVMDCVENRKVMAYPFDREKDWQKGGIRISYGFLVGHLVAQLMQMYH